MSSTTNPEGALARRLGELFAAGGFWRERWRRAGIEAAPSSLDRLPIVTADELAANEAAEPPYGSWRAPASFVRVGVPIGPSALEMLVFSADDLEREAQVGARSLATAGLAPGMRETNTLPGGLPTPGSLVVGDAAQALGALDMPVGPIDAEGPREIAYDFWSRVRPDFAVLDVAGARALAALLAAKGRSARDLGLGGVAILADLRDGPGEVADFGVPTRRIVGLGEAFSLLATAEEGGAFFPPSDEVIAEVLDGQLVLTTLHHSAALTRFAPGARAEIVRRGAANRPEERGFRLV